MGAVGWRRRRFWIRFRRAPRRAAGWVCVSATTSATNSRWEPGRREIRRAHLWFTDPVDGETHIEVEKLFTFRMRGIGYWHPHWGHGSNHGQFEIDRESIDLDAFEPTDFASIHLQNVVKATMGGRTGIGVVEQIAIGPHEPSGLKGFLDGYQP